MVWARRLQREATFEAVVGYVCVQHWHVCPGEYRVDQGPGPRRCSCGNAACRRPGEHPVAGWEQIASTDADTVRDWWRRTPDAPIVLPTGRSFDVVEVPVTLGRRALERLAERGRSSGPVALTYTGRFQLFLRAGVAARLPGLLDRAGVAAPDLQLVTRSVGDFVLAPPSFAGARRLSSWVRPPDTPLGGTAQACLLAESFAVAATDPLSPGDAPRRVG